VCRERCFKNDWVIDLDITKFFDTVPWDLIVKAVAHHVQEDPKWVLLYVERWLKAPLRRPDGSLTSRERGTPQGAVVSPLLANLFMNYAFDAWMAREFRAVPFERYSDDIVVHCVSERQARCVQAAIARRLAEVGLELHPDKTRLVYCKDSKRRGTYENTSFTFLGYTFRPRKAFNKKTAEAFTGFLPGVSRAKLTQMSRRVRAWRPLRLTTNTLDDLARGTNPVVRGWLAYFTAFYPTAVTPVRMRLDRALMRWARRKYKRLSSLRSPWRAARSGLKMGVRPPVDVVIPWSSRSLSSRALGAAPLGPSLLL